MPVASRPSRPRRVQTNLVVPASSFVGREPELATLARLFEEARLVTILGPGGIGKTRIALRYCEERLAAHTSRRGGGVWFVDLTETRTASSALATIAAVLGVELGSLATDETISDALGQGIARLGRVLIVFDNLERVAAGLAPAIGRWVGVAPSARILVTSRVAMAIAAEHVLPLGPLSRDEATDLFVGRARLVRGGDDIEDRSAVGEIVDAIDCMPLAIELAASRTRLLSTADMRARLARPLEFLGDARTADRHGSVRRAVLDSVALLGTRTLRLFGLASVLRNGFTLADAEAVVGGVTFPRTEILDGLDSLARTSLLRVNTQARQPARYGYFETIRDVAEEFARTDPEQNGVLAKHASHYATRAIAQDARADLENELENFLLAHDTAVGLAMSDRDPIRAEEALNIAIGVEPLLSARGLSRIRARLFDQALAALDATGLFHAEQRFRGHVGRGLATRELGETARATRDFERALELSAASGMEGFRAVALTQLGAVRDVEGDTAGARGRLREALALLARTDQDVARTSREAEVHLLLGHGFRREGDLVAAKHHVVEAVARYRLLQRDEGLASAMYELAVIELFAGRRRDALVVFDEGLVVARRGDVRLVEGALTTARGCLLQEDGDVTLALEHHAEAARIFRELGSRYREASALYYLATAYIERDEPAEALAVLVQAHDCIATVRAPRYEALIASAMATALAWLGRFAEAEREWSKAERAVARVPSEPSLAVAIRVQGFILEVRSGRRDERQATSEAQALVGSSPSDDSRFALRALQATVSGRKQASSGHELLVWPDASAFMAPGAKQRVSLTANSPLRRILASNSQAPSSRSTK
jgi:predicted ATPase